MQKAERKARQRWKWWESRILGITESNLWKRHEICKGCESMCGHWIRFIYLGWSMKLKPRSRGLNPTTESICVFLTHDRPSSSSSALFFFDFHRWRIFVDDFITDWVIRRHLTLFRFYLAETPFSISVSASRLACLVLRCCSTGLEMRRSLLLLDLLQ